jgi:hypothetical protein
MKLNIHVRDSRETVEVANAEAGLKQFKREAAKRAPFLVRAGINAMSDLSFAGEAVKRNNAANNRQDPPPKSAQEFLDWAVERGYITIVQP